MSGSATTARSSNQLASRSNEIRRPLILVVEGFHDVQFLRGISRVLHDADPSVVDLATLENHGRLVFLPLGGGDVLEWTNRLAALRSREIHLYDRETGAATQIRLRASQAINRRPGCHAFVMAKRSLENYLHPQAIHATRGIGVEFHDSDDVATLVAQHIWQLAAKPIGWSDLARRSRYRLRAKVKRWLNTQAVLQMNHDRLRERDPADELWGWLRTIQQRVEQ